MKITDKELANLCGINSANTISNWRNPNTKQNEDKSDEYKEKLTFRYECLKAGAVLILSGFSIASLEDFNKILTKKNKMIENQDKRIRKLAREKKELEDEINKFVDKQEEMKGFLDEKRN